MPGMLAQSPSLLPTLLGLSTALGVGLLAGIERERSKGRGPDRGAAGVRTFALLGLAGAIAQLVGQVGVAVAGGFTALAAIASYRRTRAGDPGLTTEVAMIATFLLGVLAMRDAVLAAGIGVAMVLVLASKSRLHRFTRRRLTERELQDGLMLVAAAFVVLPLLPDRAIDPWGALNPRRLWLLVVALMAVSSAGYVALRLFGSRLGLALAGLAGGFVSSTATIAAMGTRARAAPQLTSAYAGAGLVSNVATIAQLAIVLGALAPQLLARASVPLIASGAAAAIAAAAFARRDGGAQREPDADVAGKRPFEPLHVLAFVGIIAAILLVSAIARAWLGASSLPWILAASGLADLHAAAASAAQMAAAGKVGQELALVAIAAALAANSLSKCVLAAVNGGRGYAVRVIPGVCAMVLAFVLGLAWPA